MALTWRTSPPRKESTSRKCCPSQCSIPRPRSPGGRRGAGGCAVRCPDPTWVVTIWAATIKGRPRTPLSSSSRMVARAGGSARGSPPGSGPCWRPPRPAPAGTPPPCGRCSSPGSSASPGAAAWHPGQLTAGEAHQGEVELAVVQQGLRERRSAAPGRRASAQQRRIGFCRGPPAAPGGSGRRCPGGRAVASGEARSALPMAVAEPDHGATQDDPHPRPSLLPYLLPS